MAIEEIESRFRISFGSSIFFWEEFFGGVATLHDQRLNCLNLYSMVRRKERYMLIKALQLIEDEEKT